MVNNIIQLFTDGKVETKDKREFTRLVGGFGKDKPMFTIWQSGELLGLRTSKIFENFERNASNFNEGIDYIDLKSATPPKDSENNVDITEFFKEVGCSQNKLNATKRWLAFSFSGMMKLVKIATTKESWNIYNDFLEDYFKTKAENTVMKRTLEEEIEFLNERKKFLLGSMFMEQDANKKIDYFNECEKINNKIKDIEITLSNKELAKQFQSTQAIADTFTHAKVNYDIGMFSKVLNIKNLGRNNLFQWLRDNEILRHNNEPYQRYMEYFEVLPVENRYTHRIDYKTMIKSNGIEYIVKKLIKDGKIITKTPEEILQELNQAKAS